jgi:hypothetical protein
LTYKTLLPKTDFIDWFSRVPNKGKDIPFIKIAHETGDTQNPYLHSHVLIDFGKAFSTRISTFADYPILDDKGIDIKGMDGKSMVIHPHIRKIVFATHWQRCLKYICKEDIDCQRDDEIKSKIKKTFIELISTAEGLTDIMRMATKPTDYPPLKMMYRDYQDTIMIPHKIAKFIKWQEEFIEEVMKGIQNDKIIWIYDKNGGGGKTELARYLCTNHPNLFMCLKNCGGAGHFGNTVLNLLKNGWKGNCLILDLPRSAEQHSIYDPIEMFKDGCISTTKYEGGVKWLPFKPIIVIFAKKNSAYKWDVRNLIRSDTIKDYIDWEKMKYEDIPDPIKNQSDFFRDSFERKGGINFYIDKN